MSHDIPEEQLRELERIALNPATASAGPLYPHRDVVIALIRCGLVRWVEALGSDRVQLTAAGCAFLEAEIGWEVPS